MKNGISTLWALSLLAASVGTTYACYVQGYVLCASGAPVSDVSIVVSGTTSCGGPFDVTATTDSTGYYMVDLPVCSASYEACLNTSTLPAGATVEGADCVSFSTIVPGDDIVTVNFGVNCQVSGCPAVIGRVNLGAADEGLVIGLQGTKINNSLVTINGDEYVSQGGSLVNMAPSTINGNVYEYANGQYSGPGKLHGSIFVNPALLTLVDADALNAAAAAAAEPPTQMFGNISSPTVVNGGGGQNVIQINGNITSTLILNGGPSDSFVVNVTGTLTLGGSDTLGLSGGVTTGQVLYNFTGSKATISTHVGNVVNGTLLAPNDDFNLDGRFNGRIIGGGGTIVLMSGTVVNQPECP